MKFPNNDVRSEPLTEQSPFPFGQHKGVPMIQVPATYLDWLRGQTWLAEWPAVAEYIERNKKAIDQDVERAGRSRRNYSFSADTCSQDHPCYDSGDDIPY